MSNYIKYYRKKDSESLEATHQAIFFDPGPHNKKYWSVNLWKGREFVFSGEEKDFDKFIEENNFEEVEAEISPQVFEESLNLALDECVARDNEELEEKYCPHCKQLIGGKNDKQ